MKFYDSHRFLKYLTYFKCMLGSFIILFLYILLVFLNCLHIVQQMHFEYCLGSV